jgi:hypothetical protein
LGINEKTWSSGEKNSPAVRIIQEENVSGSIVAPQGEE